MKQATLLADFALADLTSHERAVLERAFDVIARHDRVGCGAVGARAGSKLERLGLLSRRGDFYELGQLGQEVA